jgi:hypothetical protein
MLGELARLASKMRRGEIVLGKMRAEIFWGKPEEVRLWHWIPSWTMRELLKLNLTPLLHVTYEPV